MSTRTTFRQLVERHGQVRIPIIQRDYAQGRKEQQIIRDDFVNALYGALCLSADDPALPLDLDFVYGSVVEHAFQPLDGQQRLTTLFLLHWYLAWVDGRGDDFRDRFLESGRSRFGYQVRPASRDFIDALANYMPDVPAADVGKPSELIKDRPWYFRNWRLDPTIRSALAMLDRMHEAFRGTSGLYARLIDDARPAITFQLLDLEQFNLSDDLYIKMNARGKSLTPFETFKARFKRHLESGFEDVCADIRHGVPIVDFFSERIDNRWSEFLWRSRDGKTATFDAAAMNLLRTVIMVTRAPAADGIATDLADLRSPTHPGSYTWFRDRGWLDREMVEALVTLLERWSADPDQLRRYLPDARHFDEQAIWEKIARSAGLTFQEVVQFAGYVQYLVHARGEIDPATFGAWMRVVYNLAVNTDYNRPEDLQRSLAGLRELTPWMDGIIRYLAGPHGDVAHFFRDLVAEERIKAHLITLGGGWPELIDRAEGHDYFRGQIGFLLHICGVNLNDPAAEIKRLDVAAEPGLRAGFERYLTFAERMFDDIVKDAAGGGRLWEQALLATGDFLPQLNRNRSLLKNTRTDPWSWKRFLRNAAAKESKVKVLKDLWDRLGKGNGFAQDLAAVIGATQGIDAWRAAIIATPSVYGYMEHGMLRFLENGGVYSLKKLQMNGRHAELFTYCLHKELEAAPPPSFRVDDYRETSSTEDEPGLVLSRDVGGLDVTFHLDFGGKSDVYVFYLHTPQDPEIAFQQVLAAEGFVAVDGQWRRILDRTVMKAAVLSLDHALPKPAPSPQ